MTDLTISELRTGAELGRAVLDARSADELEAHLRRLRHLVPYDEARLRRRRLGAPHPDDPSPPGLPCIERVERTGDQEVELRLVRAELTFSRHDVEVLDLVRPFLATAMKTVGAVEVEVVDLTGVWSRTDEHPVVRTPHAPARG